MQKSLIFEVGECEASCFHNVGAGQTAHCYCHRQYGPIAMIVLQGPALGGIPIGLAIMATNFVWARRLPVSVKERIKRLRKWSGYNNDAV